MFYCRLKRRLAGEDVPPLTTRRAVNRTQGSALTGESERDVLLAEQKSYDRVAIEAEKAKQTKALVDNMWQGLE